MKRQKSDGGMIKCGYLCSIVCCAILSMQHMDERYAPSKRKFKNKIFR